MLNHGMADHSNGDLVLRMALGPVDLGTLDPLIAAGIAVNRAASRVLGPGLHPRAVPESVVSPHKDDRCADVTESDDASEESLPVFWHV